MAANSSKTKLKKSLKPAELPLSSSSPSTPVDWLGILYGPSEPGAPSQEGAAEHIIELLTCHKGAGLLSDPGTGKTIVTMAVLQHFMPKRVLIVAPLTSLEVTWNKRLVSLYANISRRIEDFSEGVLLIGFEHFRQNIKKIVRFADKHGFDMAVIDESQNIKHRGSNQSRAIRRLRAKIPKRLILSGTPMDESPVDMWAQMRFIEPGVLGDVWAPPRDSRKYKGPYFEEDFLRPCGFMGYDREFIPGCLPEFLERVSPYLYRLPNDLIEAKIIPVIISIKGKQRDIYDQMMTHGIIKIKGKKSKAGLKPIRDLRCFQIVGGTLPMDDGTIIATGDAKLDALETLLKDHVHDIRRPVVFCRFLTEMNDVEDVLRERYERVRTLSGAVKDKAKNKARTRLLEDFQAGLIDALVVQARTGGTSIEFTASRDLIFYSMGYSYIDFQQIIARFRRYGQEKQVRVFLIVARNTIDEEPMKRIETKSANVNPIMDHIKEKSMAVVKKSAKKAVKKVEKKVKAAVEAHAFGVAELAEYLDIGDSGVRVKLRDNNIPKKGKSYGWDTKAEMVKVADKISPKEKKAA
jgi:SNF2 family DNA or RNA helicase